MSYWTPQQETHVEHACSLIDPGLKHVLEFGVYMGKSISKIRARLDDSYLLFGFDSFEGLPEDWVDREGNLAGGTMKKGSFSTQGVVPEVPGVKFFKGWFDETIPLYRTESAPIGLLHVDCDLYSSAKTVLFALDDLIVPGTIIVFDEWVYNFDARFDDHEQRAFREWIAEKGREFELVRFDGPSIEQQIVRIVK